MRTSLKFGRIIVALALTAVIAACSQQEPPPAINRFMVLFNDSQNHVAVPHAPDLELPFAFTIEGWVRFEELAGECVSLVGKDFEDAYWVGWCDEAFRSYAGGDDTDFDAGTFELNKWTHFAVTSSSSGRSHYIDGEFVGSTPLPHATGTGEAELRIGSDVSWEYPPSASLDEIRIWNRALTPAEIRNSMNTRVVQAQPGLVAAWSLEFDGGDGLNLHNGAPVASPSFGFDGRVTPNDPTMPVVYVETPDCVGQGEDLVHHITVPFNVPADGDFRISLRTWSGFGSFYVYEGPFNPANGLNNCLAGNNSPVDGRSTLDVTLTTGVPHTIVVFNDNDVPAPGIEFTVSIAAL
ncbi:MAG: LamG domain-containing protein [Trueperaceae bacterium]|nr:LamG domain-containing protein [Trueperaceae bacterium]